jgi:predicted permease
MDLIFQELLHAARRLARAPVFAVTATLTLALAIGANASIFAVVERVLLNPLPYPDSDRLIELDHGSERLRVPASMGLTQGLYFHYADRSHTLDRLAIYARENVTLTGDGDPERIVVVHATPSLAPVLRVAPAFGRWFSEQEARPGATPVAVVSHGLWVRRHGGDARIVGRTLNVGGVRTEVIGVMPASFAFPDPRVDMWLPDPIERSSGFGLWSYNGVARLRDGVSVGDARAELNRLLPDVVNTFPGDVFAIGNVETRLIFTGKTLKEATVGGVARALWTLLASVGVVMLVACANVANLFLVRSDARQREVAVRRALGATRLAIVRYFLSESALLSLAGGLIGLALAAAAVRLLVAHGPATLPRLHEIRLDAVTLGFDLTLSVIAALSFGAIPLWRGAAIATSLQEIGRGATASRARHHARRALMGGQVALALVLLVSSVLMIRSFQKLRATDPGFDARDALTFTIGLSDRDYRTRAAALTAHNAILDRLATLPGVTAVSASTCLPLSSGCFGNTVRIEGRPYAEGSPLPIALFRAIAGGYFETMRMRILRGRGIDRGDVERGERVIVVNELFSKRYFPNQDPIGQHVASNRPPAPDGRSNIEWLTIVGVVSDTPTFALAEPNPIPQLFMPMSIAGGPGIPASPGHLGDELRRRFHRITGRAAADGAPRGRRCRQESRDRTGPNAAGDTRPRVGADGIHDGVAGDRVGRDADARNDRHLRRHVVHREPADR